MRWERGHRSDDVIDRRDEPRQAGMGGLGALIPFLLRFKYGWVVVLLIVGGSFVRNLVGGDAQRAADPAARGGGGEAAEFVAFVLDDAQKTWTERLASGPVPYRRAKLVLFTDATRTGCGYGEAATGPFYCPMDERVYIDLGFFDELSQRFGAKGDFAQAYVIAHEIGHHVQKVLGISERMHEGSRGSLKGASGQSVRLELQADCFAGVWAHSTERHDLLEKGDLEEALTAATAIGDDRLQRQSQGTVTPESFTHGTSEQRSRWFRRGFETGKPEACDTFSAPQL